MALISNANGMGAPVPFTVAGMAEGILNQEGNRPIHWPRLSRLCQQVDAAAKGIFRYFGKGVEKFGIGSVFFLPVYLINIVRDSYHVINGNTDKKIDSSINALENLRCFGKGVGTLLVGLEDIYGISVGVKKWGAPFATTLSILSIVSIVSCWRTCVKMKRVMSEFNHQERCEDEVDKRYQKIIELFVNLQMDDSDFYPTVFNNEQEVLNAAFHERENQANQCGNLNGKNQIFADVIISLKGRIQQNIDDYIIYTISSTINVLGLIALFALPATPLGWSLISLGFAIDTISLINHKIVEYHFAKEIGFKRSIIGWITC